MLNRYILLLWHNKKDAQQNFSFQGTDFMLDGFES
jgi:hypothetical protein